MSRGRSRSLALQALESLHGFRRLQPDLVVHVRDQAPSCHEHLRICELLDTLPEGGHHLPVSQSHAALSNHLLACRRRSSFFYFLFLREPCRLTPSLQTCPMETRQQPPTLVRIVCVTSSICIFSTSVRMAHICIFMKLSC